MTDGVRMRSLYVEATPVHACVQRASLSVPQLQRYTARHTAECLAQNIRCITSWPGRKHLSADQRQGTRWRQV